jgi:hypothetical protein
MNYSTLFNWTGRKLNLPKRLKKATIAYLLFLMVSARKHTQQGAAEFSGLSKSSFSKFLKNHRDLAVTKLCELSKKQAKQFGKDIRFMADGKLPWKIAIIIDATLQRRTSLHSQNVKKFNHGNGFVIGHQWTNIVLFVNDLLIPLEPIPFYTKAYCRKHKLTYQTEHQRIVKYLDDLDLRQYIGPHDPKQVLVLGDSGYDDKKIEKTIASKGWTYLIALKNKRSIKTLKEYANTPKSSGWHQIERFFKNHRRIKWITVFFPKNSPKEKKRTEVRARQITGYLRHAGKAQLICSEMKTRRKQRRKHFACNDLKATLLQILLAYRIRWQIELFHKKIKMFLGFEDVAPKFFDSVVSHVHWVYCAYILLHSHPPGIPKTLKSVEEKQQLIMTSYQNRKISSMLQVISQFNGVDRLKKQLREALECNDAKQILI